MCVCISMCVCVHTCAAHQVESKVNHRKFHSFNVCDWVPSHHCDQSGFRYTHTHTSRVSSVALAAL